MSPHAPRWPTPSLRGTARCAAPVYLGVGLIVAVGLGCGSRYTPPPALPAAAEGDGAEHARTTPPPVLSAPMRPRLREHCRLGRDEDRDGLVDCADPDCWGPACAEDCDRRGDEDGDGLVNCADADCAATCVEDCGAPGDEDGDGLADCEDADCAATCVEACGAPGDEDADGLADCDDADCGLLLPCWAGLALRPVGGADLRAARVTTATAWHGGRHTEERDSFSIDALELSGEAHDPTGAPLRCAARAEGLWLTAQATYTRASAAGTDRHQTSGIGAATLTLTAGDCPAPTEAELALLGLYLARTRLPSDWAPGDHFGLGALAVGWAGHPSAALTPAELSLGPRFSSYSRWATGPIYRASPFSHAGQVSQTARAGSLFWEEP